MISECNYQLGKQVFDTEDGVVELLQKHPWPFNFIQFRELVRNAVIMSKSSLSRVPPFRCCLAIFKRWAAIIQAMNLT